MDEQANAAPRPEESKAAGGEAGYTVEGLLARIDKITRDTEYIHQALDTLRDIYPTGNIDSGNDKAESVAKVVAAREATNQQILSLLGRIYDDLKPTREPAELGKFRAVVDGIKSMGDSLDQATIADIIGTVSQQMFSKAPVAFRMDSRNGGSYKTTDPAQRGEESGKGPKGSQRPPKGWHVGKNFNAADFLRNMAGVMDGDGSGEEPEDNENKE